LIYLLAVLTLVCTGCTPTKEASPKETAIPVETPAAEYTKFTRLAYGIFDTEVQLLGYAESQEAFDQIADGLMALLKEYNQYFDIYNSYPGVHNLRYVNDNAAKGPVEIPKPLFDLIAWCREKWESNPSSANAAMGAVLSIWHDYRSAGLSDPSNATLPPMEQLSKAAKHTDFSQVILDKEKLTVYFADPLLKLDVGAIAKGFAADLAREYLRQHMPSYLLSLGGNVITGEPPRDGRLRWGISIQDPDDFSGMLDTVYVYGLSVVTSGDYWRYYVVDGENYHHIIDPKTLMPARHIQAVTVICESSALADYLTTTLFLMPYEEGRKLVESMDGVEALWSLMDGTVVLSDGMTKYARSHGINAYTPY